MEVPFAKLGDRQTYHKSGNKSDMNKWTWEGRGRGKGYSSLRKLLIAFPFVVCLIAHECLFSKMRFCFRQEKKRKIGFQFVIVTITRKYRSFFERYQFMYESKIVSYPFFTCKMILFPFEVLLILFVSSICFFELSLPYNISYNSKEADSILMNWML